MKNAITNLSLCGVAFGVLGLFYKPVEKILLSLILLLWVGVLINYILEKRNIREILAGVFVLPILATAFFYKFAADLAFAYILMFFTALLVLSAIPFVSEKQKRFAAIIAFLGSVAVGFALNYRTLFEVAKIP